MIIVKDRNALRVVGALRFKARLNHLPGKSQWKDDQFFIEMTRDNIEWLEQEFPLAQWNCSALEELKLVRAQEESARSNDLPDVGDHCFKTTPFNHQMEAFLRSRDMNYYAYLMEMGTGKTKVLVDNIAWLWHNSKIDGAIIAAPNGVHRQFITEQVPLHMPEDVEYECFVYQSGGDKAFQRRKAEFLKPSKKLRILSINIESLSVKSGFDYVLAFLKSLGGVGANKPVLMAVDESTRIKNTGSKRTKNVIRLGRFCAYRRILSGSPITKGVEDIFGQLSFLSDSIIGCTSFYTFRNKYCILEKQGGYGASQKQYDAIVGYQNIDELKRKIAPWVFRVKKEDCLDLPPKVYATRHIPLSKQQADMYNQLREELLLEFENSSLQAPMAAVRMTKLQQILCGHIRFTEENRLVRIQDVPRFDITRDLVEEAQDQVIIWARFTPDIDRLCEILAPWGVSRYDGRVSNDDRQKNVNDFRSGKNKSFVGQPASAGLGLNLVGPTTVIYYSNSFDAEHRWQSEDRNHRAGTTKSVTYYDLVVPNSIDTHVLKILGRKQDIASQTLSDLKKMLYTPPLVAE